MDNLLAINPGLMIWTIVSFLIFVFLLRKLAWGPIMSGLDMREKGIRDSIEQAERNREESEKILDEQKEALRRTHEEAKEMIARSRDSAEKEGNRIIEKARKEGDDLIERARAEIRSEERRAVEEVRRQAVDIALDAAGRLIRKSLETEDHRRIVEDFIARLGSERDS